MDHYILRNGRPVKVSMLEWAEWLQQSENREVESTIIGRYQVSTVFLGINAPGGIYETMVFNTNEIQRYWTLGEAKKGHFEIVKEIEQRLRAEAGNGGE